jgi:hypothetical protein
MIYRQNKKTILTSRSSPFLAAKYLPMLLVVVVGAAATDMIWKYCVQVMRPILAQAATLASLSR